MSETKERDLRNRQAESLVGVIKGIVRAEFGDRERAANAANETVLVKSRRGQKWSEEEEDQLLREFQIAISIIGTMHRRTEGAIFARLMELRDRDRLQYRVPGSIDSPF